MNVFAYVIRAPLERGSAGEESLAQYRERVARSPFTASLERAIYCGFHADRLGFAFAGGYGAALRALFEHAGAPVPSGTVSLAATEKGGAHPRAIATRLDEGAPRLGGERGALVLRGEKTFATLASAADHMLVVASRGFTPDGKNRLCIVQVPRDARGVVIEDRPPMPFAPEIPQAIVRFEDVVIAGEAVLPGDGYEAWLKPFRTIEDTHVLAATVGYLIGAARAYGWESAMLAELVGAGVALVDIRARDPSDPLAHVALAGLFAGTRRLIAALEAAWLTADEIERARWQRDLPLLLVAENARTKRTESALAALRTS